MRLCFREPGLVLCQSVQNPWPTCFDYLVDTVSRSAFQYVCGDRITGDAPCSAVDTAESAFLFTRKMKGSCSTRISCTRSMVSFRLPASFEDACSFMSRSISASHGVSGDFSCGFHW